MIRLIRSMIFKTIVVMAIPLLIAGYARNSWNADELHWANARTAAELRYWQMIDLNCRLGEINDRARCADALNNLSGRDRFSL